MYLFGHAPRFPGGTLIADYDDGIFHFAAVIPYTTQPKNCFRRGAQNRLQEIVKVFPWLVEDDKPE